MSRWIIGTVLFFILSLLIGQGTAQSKQRWWMDKNDKWQSQRPGFTVKPNEPVEVCMRRHPRFVWEVNTYPTEGRATIVPSKLEPQDALDFTCFDVSFPHVALTGLKAELLSKGPTPDEDNLMQFNKRGVMVKSEFGNRPADCADKIIGPRHLNTTSHRIKSYVNAYGILDKTLTIIAPHFENVKSDWEIEIRPDVGITKGRITVGLMDSAYNKLDVFDVLITKMERYEILLHRQFTGPVEGRPYAHLGRVDGIDISIDLEVYYGYTPTDE